MYYLTSLPEGYAWFEMDQPAGKQVYKRLFGHPSGRFYDSIKRFETHVWWLLDGRKGLCECFLCGNYRAPPGPPRPRNKLDFAERPTATPKASIRRNGPTQALKDDDDMAPTSFVEGLPMDRIRRPARGLASTDPVDEEGTRDVWKEVINRIYIARDSKRGVEDDIREENSIDWLSERDSIPQYFTKVEQQHSFVPRIGELVLWCPSFPEDLFLQRDPASDRYQFYSVKDARFTDQFPQWRGGVVTAVPSRASQNGAIDFTDLLNLPEKKTSLNTSGFRVETMPDPNSTDKSLSKQYRYVPLRNIRPLSQWQLLLKGIPQKELHASVLYALTCMTSISLIDKWRINGDWTDGAFISAKGMYLGSELITVGDAVRLASVSSNPQCTDIMVVDTIRLYLEGLKHEYLDLDSTRLCSRSKVTLLGKAYSIRSDRAFSNPDYSQSTHTSAPISDENVKSVFRPVGTALYGSWYPLHHVKDRLEVSYDQVLGRLYEAEAIRLWSGQRQQHHTSSDPAAAKSDLAFDMSSIIAGRRYATKVDERMPGLPVTDPNEIRWLISDYRAQSLDVASFNGLEVGPYFEARTPATLAAWRAHIKISNGEKVTAEELTSAMGPRIQVRPSYRIPTLAEFESSPSAKPGGKRRGRPPGSKLINGKLYRAGEVPHLSEVPIAKRPMTSIGSVDGRDSPEETDYEGEDPDADADLAIEIAETQHPHSHKHSSQMAGAALMATDSEDIDDYSDHDRDIDDNGQRTEDEEDNNETTITSKALLAAYGADDDATDDAFYEFNDDIDVDSDNPKYLSAWQRNAVSRPILNTTTQRPKQTKARPMSKSQIMESVEQGHGSTLASISGPVYDDSEGTDEEEEEFNLEEWKNPRNARGGTEESSGGDYKPE